MEHLWGHTPLSDLPLVLVKNLTAELVKVQSFGENELSNHNYRSYAHCNLTNFFTGPHKGHAALPCPDPPCLDRDMASEVRLRMSISLWVGRGSNLQIKDQGGKSLTLQQTKIEMLWKCRWV